MPKGFGIKMIFHRSENGAKCRQSAALAICNYQQSGLQKKSRIVSRPMNVSQSL